jgi:hypothetical protein
VCGGGDDDVMEVGGVIGELRNFHVRIGWYTTYEKCMGFDREE